ncbi:hypothetical protein ACFXPN_45855 [Streptomyces griseorubiginosus]|uniref:hypothetical protein n=1 Tax=Streptomyces griseorubiginosus TaxID=67304 RepID=UPI003688A011
MPDAKRPAILRDATVKNDDGSYSIEVPPHITALLELGDYPEEEVPEFDFKTKPESRDAIAWHEMPYKVVQEEHHKVPHRRITWMVENYDIVPITITAWPTEVTRDI